MPEPADALQPLRRFVETLPPRRRRDIGAAFAGGAGVLSELTERYGDEVLDSDQQPLHDLLTAMACEVALEFADVVEDRRGAHIDAAGLTDEGDHIVFCANVLDTTFADLESIAASGVPLPGSVVSRLGVQVDGIVQLARAAAHEDVLEPGPPAIVLGRRHLAGR
jgi:hypothetical protein